MRSFRWIQKEETLLFPGANRDQTEQEIIKVLEHFSKGDYLFLQNEINGIELLIQEASKRGMKIVLNPSPFEPEIMTYDLEKIEWIILNEVEVCQMTGEKMIESDTYFRIRTIRFFRIPFTRKLLLG